MSDVVAVALISAASSLLGAAVGATSTYLVGRRSASAESERLLIEQRENERRNRQATYYEMIDAYREVFQILGWGVSEEVQVERTENFNHQMAGILLFGPPQVRSGADALNEVFEEIWPRLYGQEEANSDEPFEECWRLATADLAEPFTERGNELIELMHADVTQGIVEVPSFDQAQG